MLSCGFHYLVVFIAGVCHSAVHAAIRHFFLLSFDTFHIQPSPSSFYRERGVGARGLSPNAPRARDYTTIKNRPRGQRLARPSTISLLKNPSGSFGSTSCQFVSQSNSCKLATSCEIVRFDFLVDFLQQRFRQTQNQLNHAKKPNVACSTQDTILLYLEGYLNVTSKTLLSYFVL